MFWKERIEREIESISDDVNSVIEGIKRIEDKANSDVATQEGRLSYYQNQCEKLENENGKLVRENERYKAEVENTEDIIRGLNTTIEDCKEKVNDYNNTKRQNELLIEQNEQLQKSLDLAKSLVEATNERIKASTRQNDALQADLTELRKCFSAVLRGMYDREEIEYAALKTYRGWKFVYNNGQMTEDFSNIGEVSCSWYDGEKLNLSMNN